jgi:hypothetical protein
MKMLANKQPSDKPSVLGGLWAITWRSIAYLPIVTIVALSWLVVALSIVVLPIVVALHAWADSWESAFRYFAAWIVFLALWRILRLGRLWETPPSVL